VLRVGDQYNYGPLRGFYLSVNGNYQLSKVFYIGIFIKNILGTWNYEFVASSPTKTTFGLELKLLLLNY
tara:strand:+ start:107 stop:313 length:207 start_codon:yes stop_codon:yes gene_type:complete